MAEAIPTEELQREAMTAPSDEALKSVGELAALYIECEEEVKLCEHELRAAKEALRVLSEQRIPGAFREHAMSGYAMADGSSMIVKTVITAAIRAKWPAEKRQKAFDWLTENGFGDLIKHEVKALFGKEEGEKALATVEELARLGVVASDSLKVDHGTLGAFVREQTEAGNAVPDDLLGVFRGEVTKIERPK